MDHASVKKKKEKETPISIINVKSVTFCNFHQVIKPYYNFNEWHLALCPLQETYDLNKLQKFIGSLIIESEINNLL